MCAGENLSMGVSDWQQAIKLWTDERGAYNWRAATFQSNAGHLCASRRFRCCLDRQLAMPERPHQLLKPISWRTERVRSSGSK